MYKNWKNNFPPDSIVANRRRKKSPKRGWWAGGEFFRYFRKFPLLSMTVFLPSNGIGSNVNLIKSRYTNFVTIISVFFNVYKRLNMENLRVDGHLSTFFPLWESFLALKGKCKLLSLYFMPIGVDYASLGVNFWLLWVNWGPLGVDIAPLWINFEPLGVDFGSMGVDFRFWESI